MEDVIPKPIHHKKKHEYEMVIGQLVERGRKNVLKPIGSLVVHEIFIAALVLIPTVEVSPGFQKVLGAKGASSRYMSGERGEVIDFYESSNATGLE
jgi:hypothetical protein